MPTPQIINIIVLGIIYILLILTFRSKIYGLLAYTCILIVRPGTLFPYLNEIRFELIVALVLLVVIFFSGQCRKSLSFSRNKITLNVFLFVLIVIVSFIFAINHDIASLFTWEFIKIYAFFLMIIAIVRTEDDLKMFIWTFALLMIWLGYEPIYNYLNDIVRLREEIEYGVASTGRAAGHVALGIYLCQGMAFLWYLTASCKTLTYKMLGVFLLLFSLFGILASGSRGALVGLIILAVLISCYSKRPLMYIALASTGLLAGLLFMGSDYTFYMSSIFDFGKSDASARSRFDGLRNGIEMLIRRPLLGVGPGCYPIARKMWFGWGLWAHNVYGQLAGDLGIIGIIVWVRLLFSYLKQSFSLKSVSARNPFLFNMIMAVIVSNGVCLALGFFAHTLYDYFWFMSAGIVIICSDLLNKNVAEVSAAEAAQYRDHLAEKIDLKKSA